MTQYIAVKPVGRWSEGQIIGELPESTITELLKNGAIKAVTTTAKPKSKGDDNVTA
jgi:hypothetical protein